ncbi:MAG: S-layer homology domain-containing protein [Oscillibacter sp.]|nr:S-layer homology domain-containing protein [Oscillibacter sp.]
MRSFGGAGDYCPCAAFVVSTVEAIEGTHNECVAPMAEAVEIMSNTIIVLRKVRSEKMRNHKRRLAQLLLLVLVMSMFEVTAYAKSKTKERDYVNWITFDQEVLHVEWEPYMDYPDTDANIIGVEKELFYRPIVYVPVGTTVTLQPNLGDNSNKYHITKELDTVFTSSSMVPDFIENHSSAQIKIESAERTLYGIFAYQDRGDEGLYIMVGSNSNRLSDIVYTFYVVGVDETNTLNVNGTRFVDVKPGDYFADPVTWAIQKGITNGTGKYSFSPNENCTTAQVITFIWRAYGSPEPSISNPFSDLTGNEYYYKPALWIYEKRGQAGFSAQGSSSFKADSECSRSMAVLYMWLAAGAPAPTETVEFSDVLPTRGDAPAMSWAVQQGITNGTGENTFSPGKICTRAEIVTFLYRGCTLTPEEIAAEEARIEADMDAFIAELRENENSR